jgi:hypothetical protein
MQQCLRRPCDIYIKNKKKRTSICSPDLSAVLVVWIYSVPTGTRRRTGRPYTSRTLCVGRRNDLAATPTIDQCSLGLTLVCVEFVMSLEKRLGKVAMFSLEIVNREFQLQPPRSKIRQGFWDA